MSELPSGFRSVMAARAPDLDTLDYFPTPPWAARAGGELIKSIDPGARTCWEPACGGGHMAHGLRDYFAEVVETDIADYGVGARADFLAADLYFDLPQADWIVTNPPFVKGEAFVRLAWERAARGVAMLLRLSFLEGAARHKLLYEDCPLFCASPFAERVPMVKGRWDPNASSATAYAWFVWLKPPPERGGVSFRRPDPSLRPIAPGAKARLSRPSDIARFAAAAPAPLLDAAVDD